LRNRFDYSVIGEGEQTYVELIDTLEHDEGTHRVKGLASLENSSTFKTGARSPQQNLALLPMPAFDLFDKEYYAAPIFGEDARQAMCLCDIAEHVPRVPRSFSA
jgi:anaerobic magnesium-protoporphyrin IX monomethyl ester cyclase